MAPSHASWWRNCAPEDDSEISTIDGMVDQLAPLSAEVMAIRELISSLELCHHKAERWIDNIIAAIGGGTTGKGLGTRPPGQQHPAEDAWRATCAALSAWVAGAPAASMDSTIGTVPASRMLAGLGERSPLKEWQVQRVIEKVRSTIGWPQSSSDPAAEYVWLLLGGGEYESTYRDDCPDRYKEHQDFWLQTVRTIFRDTEGGNDAELSLGLAIDMLWPCHWKFVDNVQIVLEAIGGRLHEKQPFAACGRNIALLPIRSRLETVSRTLHAYWSDTDPDENLDDDLLAALGEQTNAKKWLAASLDKTIRLQLDPPAGARAMSALNGPDWIRS